MQVINLISLILCVFFVMLPSWIFVCLIFRPLPQEMVHYAREDTHYLLYISDRLHNELLKSGNANNNLLQSVYSKSKNVCLKVCLEQKLHLQQAALSLLHALNQFLWLCCMYREQKTNNFHISVSQVYHQSVFCLKLIVLFAFF